MDQQQKPDYDVISVGAGFAGLALIHHLREAIPFPRLMGRLLP